MQCSYLRNTRISDLSIPGIVVIARSGSWHAMFEPTSFHFPVHIVEPRLLIRGVAIKPVVQVLVLLDQVIARHSVNRQRRLVIRHRIASLIQRRRKRISKTIPRPSGLRNVDLRLAHGTITHLSPTRSKDDPSFRSASVMTPQVPYGSPAPRASGAVLTNPPSRRIPPASSSKTTLHRHSNPAFRHALTRITYNQTRDCIQTSSRKARHEGIPRRLERTSRAHGVAYEDHSLGTHTLSSLRTPPWTCPPTSIRSRIAQLRPA